MKRNDVPRHVRVRAALFASVLLMIASTCVSAQNPGSQADQEACTPDVFRLCQDYIPDEPAIVACLQAKREQLSPACHQVFRSEPSQSARPRHESHRRRTHHHMPVAR